MLYLIYGNQPFTIQHRFKSIAKEVLGTPDEMNYVKLDATEVSLQAIIDEATLTPLGYDAKVVVVENCNFLVKETKTLKESKEYKEFLSYLKNIDEMTTLILTVYESDIDKKGSVINIVNEVGKVLCLGQVSEDQWLDYVYSLIKKSGAEIDKDAASELARRTGGDVALLRNTVNKLILYTPHITYADINLMVVKPLEENVFLIYNNLISKKEDFAIKVYRDLVEQNIEPVRIISTLGNQFRLLHEVKYLVSQRMNNKDIADTLKIKETRAAVIARQVYSIDEKKIRRTLDELFNLDYQIKSGQVDRYYALEMFLIKFNQD
ncbi:MAG: DNA polymerase III subunit delta [Erysipelotrichaceae bacterium]|nr:DNA polymerase III subunit delta [Erysipelotrichaceae bacterium]